MKGLRTCRTVTQNVSVEHQKKKVAKGFYARVAKLANLEAFRLNGQQSTIGPDKRLEGEEDTRPERDERRPVVHATA
jgi:hypothetical protein